MQRQNAGCRGAGYYTDLLDEVTSLVEMAHGLRLSVRTEFLAVPQECLILTMKTNQKYFSVV